MPQDSGTDAKGAANMAALAKTILEDAEAEPIPEALITLAHKLESTISDLAADPSQDRGTHDKVGKPSR